MLNRAYRLSSNWKHFINECEALKLTFSNLLYPSQLIETVVNQFITNVATDKVQGDADRNNDTTPTVTFSIPFISQSAADSTRRHLQYLSSKIGVSLQPIFTSKKIVDITKTPNQNRRSLTNNALFITLNVVYANWTMLVLLIDTLAQ